MNAQSPIVSEFATPQDAAAYEEWLADKIATSRADPRAPIAHDDVMAGMKAIIEEARRRDDAC